MNEIIPGVAWESRPCEHVKRFLGRGEDGGVVVESWACALCGQIMLAAPPRFTIEAGPAEDGVIV